MEKLKTRRVMKDVSKTALRFGKIRSQDLRFEAQTSCLQCAKPITVTLNEDSPILWAGTEFLGTFCTGCLSPASQVELARLRTERAR